MIAVLARSCVVVFILAACFQGPAVAQSDRYDPALYVTETAIGATHTLLNQVLPGGVSLTLADAKKIRTSAVLSAMGERCGLPWGRRVYLPMMAYYRHTRKLNENQMTALGVVHGVEQGMVFQGLRKGACPAGVRDKLSQWMARAE